MSYRYILGPVKSRRLGLSLGIDIITKKICSFDCLYCEAGKTEYKTVERKEWNRTEDIIDEISYFFKNFNQKIDYITFSGKGEPTLHSNLGKIIEAINQLTDTPIAILTNSSLIFLDDVKKDLMKADLIVPSLDAATELTFKKIDLPDKSLKFNQIVDGLIEFRKIFKKQIWLEILVLEGINDSEEEFFKFRDIIKEIKPDKIQLNRLDRSPAYKISKRVSDKKMAHLKSIIDKNVIVEVV